jgi:hypothetical protein
MEAVGGGRCVGFSTEGSLEAGPLADVDPAG